MLYKISFFCLFWVSLVGKEKEEVFLKTPQISQQEMIGTNVGIRPYRKSGVRLESEWLQDKLIIHNYGYGGSGLTLAFGGSKEVLRILDEESMPSRVVAILGAGVVGMATAYDLLEKNYEVHLYSDQWNPNLTSNVAAGIWTPLSFPLNLSEEKKDLHQQMLESARERFSKSISAFPEFAGLKMVCYYRLISDQNKEALNETPKGEEVIIHFDNGVVINGYKSDRIGIDGKVFMEDLYSKVKEKGGILHQRHFESLEDVLNLEEPIIINCMSMGSREVFADEEFIPIRGQLVYFRVGDEMNYVLSQAVLHSNYSVYIYPWSDRLIVGGISEIGEESPVTTPEVIDTIIQNAQKCLSGQL